MGTAERQPLVAGEVVGGKYRIERPLGRGGMANVFAAMHLELGGLVALKVLVVPNDDPRRKEAILRFTREGRAMFALKSEHVARVFDVGTLPSGVPFLVMEYLEGDNLEALAREGPLGVARAVRYVREACLGVAEAHAIGVVHRDIKPSNLVVARTGDRTIVKVIDFGIAKPTEPAPEDVAVTSTRTMVGTPRYMAPERFAEGSEAAPTADVWGLGAVLYRLLTGQPPYDAPTAHSLQAKMLTEDPIAPETLRPEIPSALARIVLRCLQRDPTERYASVAELADALEPFAERGGDTTRLEPKAKTRGVTAPLAIVLLCAAAGGLLIARRSPSPTPPPAASSAPNRPATALHVVNPRRMTFGEGCEELPAFTHDGRSIVYDATSGATSSILLMDAESGGSRAITTVEGWDYAARPSPDGARVAFLRSAAGRTAVYVADLRGGAPPKLFAEGNGRPSWSLDGRSLWAGDRAHLVRYDAETGAVQETLAVPVGFQAVGAIELPGGELAVLFPEFDGTEGGGLGVFDARRAFAWKLRADVGEFAVMPEGRELVVARKLISGKYEVVDVPLAGAPLDGGSALPGWNEVTPHEGLDVSSDGKRIAWSTCDGENRLAAIDAQGALAPLTIGGDRDERDVAWVPGTDRLVVVSARGGPLRPWIVDQAARLAPSLVPLDGPEVTGVAVSPDGKWLAVEAPPEGIRVVALADPAGVRTVTSGRSDAFPSFRRGSAELLFTRTEADGAPDVRVVSTSGGEARVLVPAPARRAIASPVDDRVVFLGGADVQKQTPMILDARVAKPLSPGLPPARYGALQFSPDGKKVAIVRAARELLEIDVASGALVRTIKVDDQITRLAYTQDRLLVVRRAWRGDLWMADLAP